MPNVRPITAHWKYQPSEMNWSEKKRTDDIEESEASLVKFCFYFYWLSEQTDPPELIGIVSDSGWCWFWSITGDELSRARFCWIISTRNILILNLSDNFFAFLLVLLEV